jgi:radical SAM enzyme (TIGR01210 family)
MDTLSMKIAVLDKLKEILKKVKREASKGYAIDFTQIGHSSIKEGWLDGKPIQRVVFYLRSYGCKWALSRDGGCLMCGHYTSTSIGRRISAQHFIAQFRAEFSKYDFEQYPMICVYNAGSFLNEEEMPVIARREIFRIIAENRHIQAVIIESRPEFITKEVTEEIEEELAGKRVEIGVGLELENDLFREICINKGFTFEEYASCAKIIAESKLHLLTYVVVKPLFLTITESIEQAIKTARRASELGSTVISLEPISLQRDTVVEYLFNKGIYSLPWGWEIIEIMKEIHSLRLPSEIRIGGFEFFPIPKVFIQNCALCNRELYEAITQYNATKDLQPLLSLQCNCKKIWEAEIAKELSLDKDLIRRVYKMLELD